MIGAPEDRIVPMVESVSYPVWLSSAQLVVL